MATRKIEGSKLTNRRLEAAGVWLPHRSFCADSGFLASLVYALRHQQNCTDCSTQRPDGTSAYPSEAVQTDNERVKSNQGPPLWGNFVFHADHDLLSFAWLYVGGLRVQGYYHATQAVEKYLKALALAVIDSHAPTKTDRTEKWTHTHDLCKLAARCRHRHPYYGEPSVIAQLQRFTEFDQLARYPLVKQKYGNGFISTDLPIFWDLITHLRTDIPIQCDDYPLGMVVRGFHHGYPEHAANEYLLSDLGMSVMALRQLFPGVKKIVRW